MTMQAQIFGVKELDEFFGDMRKADKKRFFQKAFVVGSVPLIDQMKSNLQGKIKGTKGTGNLLNSIGFIAHKPKAWSVSAKIGARRNSTYKGFHGHLFDAGTKTRSTKKGANRGVMPGSHFFTDAVNSKSPIAIELISENVIAQFDAYIVRQIKKANRSSNKITFKQFQANRAAAGW